MPVPTRAVTLAHPEQIPRARYLNPNTGRFWTMDSYEGDNEDPLSLHRYMYCEADPVDGFDPSGNDDGFSGGDSLDSMTMSVLSAAFQSVLNKIEPLGLPATAAPYRVVVVTSKNGTSYEPKTKVKDDAQSGILGLPIGTPIHIPVPLNINPQGLVDTWAQSPSVLQDPAFFWFWRPGGPNDYKIKISQIFDAFGNFEYGATGAGRGMYYSTLQTGGDAGHPKSFFQNSAINRADIKSGFDAISQGGKLRVCFKNLNSPDFPRFSGCCSTTKMHNHAISY